MAKEMAENRKDQITGVVTEYGNRLFRFIRGRVATTEDAEDILQDVWFQFSKAVGIEPIEQISGWLYRVARNRIIDRSRKRKEDLVADFEDRKEDSDQFLPKILLADNRTPETETLRSFFWEAMFEALDELPDKQRDVFVWHELEDQTFQEISDRTGVNIKTLISRKRYAVQYLRTRLQSLYDEL